MLIKFLQFMREGNINRVLYVIFRDGEFLCMDYCCMLTIVYTIFFLDWPLQYDVNAPRIQQASWSSLVRQTSRHLEE